MNETELRRLRESAARLQQAGRPDEAEALYRRILAARPDDEETVGLLANLLLARGRATEAIAICQGALAARPDSPQLHNSLADALQGVRQFDAAVGAYRKALEIEPNRVQALANLGNALRELGRFDEAADSLRRAAALRPDLPEIHNLLGAVLLQSGDARAASDAFARAIGLRPEYPEAHNNLGNALRAAGRAEESIRSYRAAVALRPGYAEAHYNLGAALKKLGQFDAAVESYRRAVTIQPTYADAWNNLGVRLDARGESAEAADCFRRALAIRPDFADAMNNLGGALKKLGDLDGAIESFRSAIRLKPAAAEIHSNLASALKESGDLDGAIDACERAMSLGSDPRLASNRLNTLHFHADVGPEHLAREQRRWNDDFARPLSGTFPRHENERSIDRKLRIGYVSPDFNEHPAGRFVLPLLAHHDRASFEIHCYSDVRRIDAMTRRLRSHADFWHETPALSDERLAETIFADRIDILVDLTMHLADNRLLVFARKPAPVQVTWLGYPGSTGLEAIDYRLSDRWIDPPGPARTPSSEKTVLLPGSFWCYDPLLEDLPVAPPPFRANGFITFGCLNNFAKVTPVTIDLWGRVMSEVPDSRLLALVPPGAARQRLTSGLGKHGIDSARIEFVGRLPRERYMRVYDRIDISLDTFPCNGHTSSLDSLWTGVPVVSLAGKTAVSRGGRSILSAAGLSELVTDDPDQFVRINVELARDHARLAELRASLRQRLQASSLMDAAAFAAGVEKAYRQMWVAWCAGRAPADMTLAPETPA